LLAGHVVGVLGRWVLGGDGVGPGSMVCASNPKKGPGLAVLVEVHKLLGTRAVAESAWPVVEAAVSRGGSEVGRTGFFGDVALALVVARCMGEALVVVARRG
jgi:hypothetical protein